MILINRIMNTYENIFSICQSNAWLLDVTVHFSIGNEEISGQKE